ncbi:E3 ubiquitin-protein ligase RSL1 [Cardamine amara subsp. amara]|uniref:RBR-type E3 ubiquitin transferase n=1 Tax=Cardamine amara subsp. amara TaxID=228776 RepID=A0ABD1AP02_CARAN
MLKGLPRIDDTGKLSPGKTSGDMTTSSHVYSLYFKGLVSEDTLAGFGVAILGQKHDLLFQMKAPIHHDSTITALEAELTALKRGLTEAANLGITHISIYCDYYPTYGLVTGRSVPMDNKTASLMNDVWRIREQFASSFPIFVAENSIKYAYELARETLDSEIRITVNPPHRAKATRKATCIICLDDNINANEMFWVDKCCHLFCSECMKRHIEVRLLERSVMRCPHYRCKSKLTFGSCVNLLTPKLRKMWQERIREDSIPMTERIYCPNPRCSALMSVNQLTKTTNEARVWRCCFKCSQLFCINCKVSWHNDLSCEDYKSLHPYPTENDRKVKALANQKSWRQCGKCQHMIELSYGCVQVQCRCGHRFCYQCGAEEGRCRHGHGLPLRLPEPPPPPPPLCISCICCLFLLFLFVFVIYYIVATFN